MYSDNFKNELYNRGISRLSPIFNDDAFTRDDSSDDYIFYQKDRFVNHIDKVAMDTVEKLIGSLVIEKDTCNPRSDVGMGITYLRIP